MCTREPYLNLTDKQYGMTSFLLWGDGIFNYLTLKININLDIIHKYLHQIKNNGSNGFLDSDKICHI